MRVLLDECLPRKLKSELTGHDVRTTPEMGWAGKKNGELLRLAGVEFDVFLTADQNLTYQQNLQTSKIGILVLVTSDNRLESHLSLLPQIRKLLEAPVKGVVRIGDKK